MFSMVTQGRARHGTIVRKGHFVPRVPVRAAGAALIAAGVAASGVLAGGAAAAAAARPAPHRNPPPDYARTITVTRLGNAGPGPCGPRSTRPTPACPAVPC